VTTFEDAVRVCLKAVQDLTGWAIGHVYLPSPTEPDYLEPSNIWYPADDKTFRELQEVTARSRFKIGSGLPGRVWETGEAIWVSDIYSDKNLPRANLMASAEVKSALGFPIKNAGSVIAVVEFFTPIESEPNRDLLLTLRTIGDQVGRVFERRLSEAELKRQTEHQQLLLGELNHRVKNMLAVVSGIASQTARNSDSIEGFTKNFLERIDALSRAHSLLTAQNWQATSLQTIAEQVFAPYRDSSAKFNVSGAVVNLMPKEALSVSLVLHEMVTNAAKHGALAKAAGSISVNWYLDQESQVRLTWSESGVGALAPPTKTGFGTKLINATIKHELQGELGAQYGSDGIFYDFRWPHQPIISGGK
jgi:two-component sensor histidine kinase